MTPLWRLVARRFFHLVLILVIFLYGICILADSRFMVIDRIDIELDAKNAASEDARYARPPLTLQEYTDLYLQYERAAAARYGFDKPLLVRVQARVQRFLSDGFNVDLRRYLAHDVQSNAAFMAVRPGKGTVRYEVSHRMSDVIANAIVPTLILFGGAFLAQVTIAFFLGLWCARRPGSALDRSTTVAGFIGTCVPPIAAAGLVVSLFVVAWRVFPGDIWIYRWPTGWSDVVPWLADFISHYLLPFLTLVVLGFGSWAIQFRNIVLETQREDFAEAARARGTPERRVVYGHVARAASPPLVSAILMGFATCFFTSFLVEPLFHWPGLGRLFWEAVEHNGDLIVFAIMMLTGVFYVICSFALELVYGYCDPRIRSGAHA